MKDSNERFFDVALLHSCVPAGEIGDATKLLRDGSGGLCFGENDPAVDVFSAYRERVLEKTHESLEARRANLAAESDGCHSRILDEDLPFVVAIEFGDGVCERVSRNVR